MLEFLTTAGTASNIEKIIIDAKSKLVLVTPYLKLTKILFDRLRDADKRGVKITLLFRDQDIPVDIHSLLGELKYLSAFCSSNLHAKCYFNEDRMVITSMNMYDFSEKNNREMGVLILRKSDDELFTQAVSEAQSIQEASEKVSLFDAGRYRKLAEVSQRFNAGSPANTSQSDNEGFCIRCRRAKYFNRFEPFCKECYYIWAEFGNPSYQEKFCHSCGLEEVTSMEKPLCYSCFQKMG